MFTHEYFMKKALQEAETAYQKGEIPIGAVVVADNQIIGKGHNQVEMLHDPTAHAEMIAISAACEFLGTKLLTDCILYVTVEPCPMCAGALFWSRVQKVVFGASEPKTGFDSREMAILHPKTTLIGGVMQEECKNLMQMFFEERRG
ncbi:MAG: nucleoside deaminase [Bacteroidia bacterium]